MKSTKFSSFRAALFFLAVLSIISCQNGQKKQKEQERPNILILLADDAGYADFGFAGSKDLKTPNIDKIAAAGTHFSDFHVSGSVCAPSRAGLLTGRYQQRFGAEFNYHSKEEGVPTSEVMLSEVMKGNGYRTAAYGKWHLGEIPEYHPNERGFDEFYGFLGGHRKYFADEKDDDPKKNTAMQHNGKYITFDGYLTDVLGEEASKFIKSDKEKPFFIYLAYNAVHTPMQATKEDMALFEGHSRQKLAAMTWAMDRSIGNVIKTLEDEGMLDNTLVFFLSDNGGPTGQNTSSNLPLKGTKGTEFEGGHRVVCAMQWGDKLKSGRKYNKLTSALDIFPTVLDACGINYQSPKKLDGVSLFPYLNDSIKSAPHEKLFWRITPWAAMRYDSLKLVRADTFGTGFYNLNEDIGEVNNLFEANQEGAAVLQEELKKWEATLMEPFGKRSPDWEEVKGYMYTDYLNNEKIKFYTPGQLKRYKKKQLKKAKKGQK